jgi:hypothetical protein
VPLLSGSTVVVPLLALPTLLLALSVAVTPVLDPLELPPLPSLLASDDAWPSSSPQPVQDVAATSIHADAIPILHRPMALPCLQWPPTARPRAAETRPQRVRSRHQWRSRIGRVRAIAQSRTRARR